MMKVEHVKHDSYMGSTNPLALVGGTILTLMAGFLILWVLSDGKVKLKSNSLKVVAPDSYLIQQHKNGENK